MGYFMHLSQIISEKVESKLHGAKVISKNFKVRTRTHQAQNDKAHAFEAKTAQVWET